MRRPSSPRPTIATVAAAVLAPLLVVPGPAVALEDTDVSLTAAGSLSSWGRCASRDLRYGDIECATLRTPMDPDDPAGATVRIAVSRVPHTSSAARYRGVILLNPGGPGVSGLAEPLYVSPALPAKVRNRYDWIGFDPRGVGASRPRLTCDNGYFGFDRPDYVPRPRSDLVDWLRRSRDYAEDCASNGQILRHMRTTDAVADMEALRVALGAEQISYLGFSYGTYLGQVYATLHPERVDRMILDSNVDPTDVFYRANLHQDVALQKNLDRWFSWIGKRHRKFRLGTSGEAVAATFDRTSRRLDRRPAAGKIGSSEWIESFLSVAYSKDFWYGRADVFSQYVRKGRTRPLVRAYRQAVDFGNDNMFAVYSAVQCTDAPWPTSWSRWSQDNWRVYRKAPNTTWMNAWYNAPCRHWPAPAGPRFPVDGSQAPAMLLVSGTHDGATPFAGSLTVREEFPRSRLVEIVGEPTHADSLGNRCSLGYVARFLGSGALPPRRAGDRADVRCPMGGGGRGWTQSSRSTVPMIP